MIKFFRKIRHRLLTENKISKYLLYAIGEIVLVVIGILIALQINNWNENKKEKNQSIFYHQQLINDLQIVISSLETDMNWARIVKTEINKATTILDTGTANATNLKTLDFAIGNYFRLNRQLPEITSYEEMKSSGQLYLIYNKSLRNDIADYLRTHYNTTNIYAELNTKVNQSKFLDPYVKFDENNTLRSTLYTYDFLELSTNKIVVNTLSRYAFHWEAKYSFANILKEEAEELSAKISKELNLLK
jgi:hypothetical protein